jgi:hypothetical protein
MLPDAVQKGFVNIHCLLFYFEDSEGWLLKCRMFYTTGMFSNQKVNGVGFYSDQPLNGYANN